MSNLATNDQGQKQSRAVDLLVSDGFVLLDQFCDGDWLESVLKLSRQKTLALKAALESKEIGIGSAAGYTEIVQRSPNRWDVPIELQEFGINEQELPWWPLIAAVLGADAEHSFSGAVSSEPGSPAQFWHIDSPHVAAEHRSAHAINILVPLHDVPLAMGPTEFARGSHRLTNHLHNPALAIDELIYQHARTTPATLVNGADRDEPKGVARPMTAGACLAFDDRIMHRGLANQSGDTRYVAYFSYRQRGYSENTHFESQNSVFDAKN